MTRMWRISRMDFFAAAIALLAVLLLGILQGSTRGACLDPDAARTGLPTARRVSRPRSRNQHLFRSRAASRERAAAQCRCVPPRGPGVYVNANPFLEAVTDRLKEESASDIRVVVLDLSASPHIDLAACAMLHKLHVEFVRQGIILVWSARTATCVTCCGRMESRRKSANLVGSSRWKTCSLTSTNQRWSSGEMNAA